MLCISEVGAQALIIILSDISPMAAKNDISSMGYLVPRDLFFIIREPSQISDDIPSGLLEGLLFSDMGASSNHLFPF